MRWWVFWVAVLVVLVSLTIAATIPRSTCAPPLSFGIQGPAGLACEPSSRIPLRLEIAGAGMAVAFILTFLAARLDEWVYRLRRSRV
jgi:hypothetical protein